MIRTLAIVVAACSLFLCSCSKKETAESPKPGAETATAASPAGGPRASVVLKDGSKVPGTVVASSPA